MLGGGGGETVLNVFWVGGCKLLLIFSFPGVGVWIRVIGYHSVNCTSFFELWIFSNGRCKNGHYNLLWKWDGILR